MPNTTSEEFAEPGELQSIGWPQQPKPRIRKRFGVWCCVTPRPFVFGHGYNPKDAYDEWAAVIEKNQPTALSRFGQSAR